MNTIAFNVADNLNREQLRRLEQAKSPPSNLVVADARRDPLDPNQLLVELTGAEVLGTPKAFSTPGAAPTALTDVPAELPASLKEAVGASLWTRRARGDARGRSLGEPGAIRILCIHGIGHGDVDPNMAGNWRAALTSQLQTANPALQPGFEFLTYDDLFDQAPHNVLTYGEAFLRLGWSAVATSISGLFGFRGAMTDSLRWTAGMVAQWAENDGLRRKTRERIAQAVQAFNPDVVVAHSLGTLISYDAFSRIKDDSGKAWDGPGLIANRFYVSLGSQIGSPFTRTTLGGRINPLAARHWFHLYNKHDKAFAAEIRLTAANFDQLRTPFDSTDLLNHDALEYFRHPAAFAGCWQSIALAQPTPTLGRGKGAAAKRAAVAAEQEKKLRLSVMRPVVVKPPGRRALLVGINDYPNEADRLEGCVNDVFLMSSVLQENGFRAEDIRVVLNDRATAAGILERMEWLLDGTEDGMDRVFYYSGHGAQIPGYGLGERVERKDECLVAYDFDWSREHSVTDDQFYELYSQLPYETRFCAIFDCCHSGGMARDGGLKIRGLTPPDDIRHRALRWSVDEGMWVPRELGSEGRKALINNRRKHSELFGERGDEHRLFRAAALRPKDGDFDRACKAYDHKGPFLPVILQACEEKQYSYEYRHGVTSYGAFTYSLAKRLRELPRDAKTKLSWQALMREVGAKLKRLKYDQTPCLVCPRSVRSKPVPWGMEVA